MLEKANTIFKQLRTVWGKLSTGKRFALVIVTGTVLLVGIYVSTIGSRPTFAVLYTELSQQDAAGIVEKLDAQKIPYRIEGGGTVIQVPEEKVHALRLELAKSGLPRGGGV